MRESDFGILSIYSKFRLARRRLVFNELHDRVDFEYKSLIRPKISKREISLINTNTRTQINKKFEKKRK